jgi:hypothetical protein
MSTQRTYQLKHKALGLCALCPRPAVNASHCKRHRDAARARDKTAWRVKHPHSMMRQCHKCGKLGHYAKTCKKKGATK